MDILDIYFSEFSADPEAPLGLLKKTLSVGPEALFAYAQSAAEAKYPRADFYLGLCYSQGLGTPAKTNIAF